MRVLLSAATAAMLLLAGGAHASTLIFSQTLTPVSSDSDTTFFDDDNDFNETFDFSAVNYTTIDSFTLTLNASGATDESGSILDFQVNEDWDIRVQGSASGSSDDLFSAVLDGANIYTITAASDTGGIDVFANAVATGLFTVWLSEFSPDFIVNNPSITVSSLRLDIHGTVAPVPLPAGFALLLAGIGGFGVLRGRRKMMA